MNVQFERSCAPGKGVPLAPLVYVVVDGKVKHVVQPALVERAERANGEAVATFRVEVQEDVHRIDDRLVEIVLNDQRDVLWTNRTSSAASLPPLTAFLHPPAATACLTRIPIYPAKETRDVAAIAATCFLRITGRLPSVDVLQECVRVLVAKELGLEQLCTQLLAREEARTWLFELPLPEDRTESDGLVDTIVRRWIERIDLRVPPPARTARQSIAIARTKAPPNTLYRDTESGIYLSLSAGIRYDDGWFSPVARFSAEFDQGFGVMVLLLWRPGIARGDLVVRPRSANAEITETDQEAGHALRIRCVDANRVDFEVESCVQYKPGNMDVRPLGFQIAHVSSSMGAARRASEPKLAVQ